MVLKPIVAVTRGRRGEQKDMTVQSRMEPVRLIRQYLSAAIIHMHARAAVGDCTQSNVDIHINRALRNDRHNDRAPW